MQAAVDEVRAADAVFSERLYDDGGGGGGLLSPGGRAAAARTGAFVDAFRSFPREGDEGSDPGASALGSLFDPPTDMMFTGGFEAAKAKAAEDDRWLMVNIQSHTEFSSMQLNRDTWSCSSVKEVVKAAFVFLQPYDSTTDGRKLKTYYRVEEPPTILVLDPMTGQKLWEYKGFVEGAALLEDLAPFFDTSPSSGLPKGAGVAHLPGAAGASGGGHKRRLPGQGGRSAGGGSGIRAGAEAGADTGFLTEDEQLARAIQDSLAEAAAVGEGAGAAARGEGRGAEAAAVAAAGEGPGADAEAGAGAGAEAGARAEDLAPEDRAAQAEAALPAEPPADDPTGCSVAVRLPDGSRLARRFPRSAPLAALYDFCVSRCGEAATGRPFSLRPAMPGAGASHQDRATSLEDAGVAGQCLRLAWGAQ